MKADRRRTRWTLAIVSLALLMVTLDNLVVTTALPVIRKDFTISEYHVLEAAAAGADAILLIAAGGLWHGVTLGALQRGWHDLVDRPSGPMSFRFILQPSMAAIAAIRDGVKDARTGFEVGNTQAVLDGDLDGFIRAYLLQTAGEA